MKIALILSLIAVFHTTYADSSKDNKSIRDENSQSDRNVTPKHISNVPMQPADVVADSCKDNESI